MHLEPSTVVGVVDRLVAKQLLVQHPDPATGGAYRSNPLGRRAPGDPGRCPSSSPGPPVGRPGREILLLAGEGKALSSSTPRNCASADPASRTYAASLLLDGAAESGARHDGAGGFFSSDRLSSCSGALRGPTTQPDGT